MQYVKCDGIDKPWSAITLGCWQLAPSGGWGDVCTEGEAEQVVKTALDSGITAFDTAEGYGDGESERRLGKALGSKKNDVVIISKIWPDAELTLDAFQKRLDMTLRALDRDYVDLYLVHWPGSFFNTTEKSEKLCELMFRLQVSGKAKTVGLSNFRAPDLKRLGDRMVRFTVNQVPYNLLEREYEDESRSICQSNGIPYMAYSPTAVGFLAREIDSIDKNFPARQNEPYFHPPLLEPATRVFETVREIAGELGVKPVQVALAWVLAQENILTAIVGSRKEEQVADLNTAGDLKLDPAHLERLTQISDAFHQQKLNR